MAFALVATKEKELMVMVHEDNSLEKGTFSHWSKIQAAPGTILNLIVYDGKSEYKTPEDTRLVEVPDDARIGDIGY